VASWQTRSVLLFLAWLVAEFDFSVVEKISEAVARAVFLGN